MTWENRITFEVSSADPDADVPVWVDFTARIRDMVQPIDLNTGRANDLDGVEPTTFTLVLENSDDALTYGNTTSPYASWWGPGRKCRLRETIGQTVIDLATGYLQPASEGLVTSGMEHRVTLPIVDRLGRLASAEPFISTLAEHIRFNGGSALKTYFTLHEPATTFTSLISGTTFPNLYAHNVFSGIYGPSPAPGSTSQSPVQPASGQSVWADDVPSLAFTNVLDASVPPSSVTYGTLDAQPAGGITTATIAQASGETFTIAMWMSWIGSPTTLGQRIAYVSNTSSDFMFAATSVAPGGAWRFQASLGGVSSTVLIPVFPTGIPFLIALRMTLPNGPVELWRNDDPIVDNTPAGVGGPTTWNQFIGPAGLQGTVGHLQVYCGAGAYTRAMHLAQYAVGMYGLERQTTGDRIRTIASYAGVRGGEMSIDTGTSAMSVAELAGSTPLDAMRDAERTEQGLLYVDGSGVLQFRDRRSLYNI